jgi:hypothetical protein
MKLETLIGRLQAAERSYRQRHHPSPHVVEIYTRHDLGDHVFVLSGCVQRRSSKYRHILETRGCKWRFTIRL